MLKRLSYPLTWVEGLTGEGGTGPPGSGGSLNKSADTDSAPNTGDSNQSVFSKVFSRCVNEMVSIDILTLYELLYNWIQTKLCLFRLKNQKKKKQLKTLPFG